MNRIETADSLDRVANPLVRAVQAVLPGRVRDALHGVWLGHPLHPVAVQFPMGAWMSAAVLDAIPAIGTEIRHGRRNRTGKGRPAGVDTASTILIGVGTVSAAPAALAGLNDWASLAPEQRRVGLVHASANILGVALYAGSFAARLTGNRRLGRRLSSAGLAVVSVGGYLGGHLSYRMGASVNQAEPFLRQIPPGWHDVGDYLSLVENRPTTSFIGSVPVLVTRTGDSVSVMLGRCAHETGPLGDGSVSEINGAACITCSWHGSTFRLSDGKVLRGPAATDEPMLRARVTNDRVEAAVP